MSNYTKEAKGGLGPKVVPDWEVVLNDIYNMDVWVQILPVFSFGILYCHMKQQVITTESRKKTTMPNVVHFTFILLTGCFWQQKH